ncbi:hypothetical protein QJU96_03065 [Pasteurella skyensis]|uniref:hypothetical protein n=1 Tax=Phocoenobacter skyensis TaxID=97481 RepID=UPI00278D415D|nr:hypothetical protein [Pasteurella skyensis]MDP8170271.1 hypothetical protein [Pasteurella skyensis]
MTKQTTKKPLNILSFKMAQLNRQFELTNQATKRCKENYPDDYHHKIKMRGECLELVKRLKAGKEIYKQLAQGKTLSKNEAKAFKEFKQALSYLIYHYENVADYVTKCEDKE